ISAAASGCEVSRVTVWPRPWAYRAIWAPVRPVKMLVMARTWSIRTSVLPAVIRRFITTPLARERSAVRPLPRRAAWQPRLTRAARPPGCHGALLRGPLQFGQGVGWEEADLAIFLVDPCPTGGAGAEAEDHVEQGRVTVRWTVFVIEELQVRDGQPG